MEPKRSLASPVFFSLMCGVIVGAACIAVLWYTSGASARQERIAHTALMSKLQEWRPGGIDDVVLPLGGGRWAKTNRKIVDQRADMQANATSRAFPYRGRLEYKVMVHSSVSYATKQAAESDTKLYRAAEMFYDRADAYQQHADDYEYTTINMLFDSADNRWILENETRRYGP